MENLREMLRCYRAENKISTRELAKSVGVSRTAISRFERNNGGISDGTLACLICWMLEKPKRLTRVPR